ncbi:MAG: HAD hydrolase-like protein, partial [Sulfurifustaceae bacterium]
MFNVFFDLDGTLTDPRTGIVASWRYLYERLGRPAPPTSELEQYIGPPLREGIARALGYRDARDVERGVEIYREYYTAVGMFQDLLHAGIDDCLRELRAAGARLYVATSKAHVYATRILEYLGVLGQFEAVYGAELDGTRGNKTELLAHLLACERLDSASAWMIGDRSHDVLAARANGVTPVGVLWGFGSRAELEGAGAKAICE